MQQLSALDAEFLYLESPKSPMHIGAVYIFGPPKEGPMTFEAFQKYLQGRLHISRTFRQRIVESPLNLGHPYWIEDPDFNLNNHLFHSALPKPGGNKELKTLAARIFSRMLDRNKPLWEFMFVEGLDNIEGAPKGSFALITKIHHAGVDGGSGAEILAALLEMSPTPKTTVPEKMWVPERLPTSFELLTKNYFKVFGTPFSLARFVYDTAQNTYKVAQDLYNKTVETPPMPFTAPKTLFNTTISSQRVFGGTEFPLDRIKEIKNAIEGVTINDTLLSICAGGLRKYLEDRGKLPEKDMVAMAPVSTRAKDQKGQMGNEVSSMLVSLATSEEDPVERLQLVHESARASKTYVRAVEATKLMDFVPSTLQALASRLYTRMKLSETHSPFYNLVITNVPGPPIELYMNGAPMLSQYGTAPVLDGLGLLLVLLSYNGKITISFTCTPELMPETERFGAFLQESYRELYEGLLKKKLPEETSAKPKSSPKKNHSNGQASSRNGSPKSNSSHSAKSSKS